MIFNWSTDGKFDWFMEMEMDPFIKEDHPVHAFT